MASSGLSPEALRRHNVSAVLRHVHVHGPASRAQLTSEMGLNRSTIKALVEELAEAGLVVEELPDNHPGAGRPSHVVVPVAASATVLAANLGVDGGTAAVVGVGGAILASRSYLMHGVGVDPGTAAKRLAQEFCLLRAAVPPSSWVVGVGVAVPGAVRGSDGWVEFAPNLAWNGVPFGDLLARAIAEQLGLDVPVMVGNDGDLGALAEHVRGAGRGVDDMVYVRGEIGVGGGVIAGGQLLRGARGFAGELGHMVVNPEGRRCRCGNLGCLETEVGEEGVLLAAGLPQDAGRTGVQDVLREAAEGDLVARAAVERAARWLGRGLGALVNLFNPALILLGDTLQDLHSVAADVIEEAVGQHSLAGPAAQVTIEGPALEDSPLAGAAELAFESVLAAPPREWWRH
ncbi:MAG: ROK family protein [Actinomycetes bacterium]